METFSKMKIKLIWSLFVFILLTMNITKVIYITDSTRFNMALSDVMIIFAVIVVGVEAIRQKSLKVIYGLPIWLALIGWLVFVGYMGVRSEIIIDGGLIGIVEELIKTGLCILYFIVGYHTLKILKLSTFKIVWSIAAVIFVFGGLMIYVLALRGIYAWSDIPNYLMVFMGTDTDPNHAASFLTLSFYAFGIFAMTSTNKTTHVWFLIILLLSIFGVILTGSRGGLVGFALGLGILILYYLKKNWQLAISLLCLFVIMGLIFTQVDLSYFDGQFTQRILSKLIGFESGLDVRLSLGYSALLMGNDYPLTGVGRGNFIYNSAPYFERIEMKYHDDIPHNTYLGLYAEVGVVGFVLYFMPLWLIIVAFIKRFKEDKNFIFEQGETLPWLIAGGVALALQAFVLNVENRRFLWYLAGILVFMFQTKCLSLNPVQSHVKLIWRKIVIFMIVALAAVFLVVAYDAHIPVSTTVITGEKLDDFVFNIPLKALKLGTKSEIGIFLSVPNNAELTDRISLIVMEVDRGGKEKMLAKHTYPSVNGKVFIPFTPSKEAKDVWLILKSLDSSLELYYFEPVALLSNEKVYEMNKWYFLQPSVIREALVSYKMLPLENYLPKTALECANGSRFSTFLEVLGTDYTFENSLDDTGKLLEQTLITVRYKVLEHISEDFAFLLLGYPYDLANMNVSTLIYAYEVYPLKTPVLSSKWIVGETYDVTYVIPRQEEIYRLKAGVAVLRNEILEHLYANEDTSTEETYLDLGWLDLDSVKIDK
ncbi:O-antigen ligase family protein [Acetoanaerobium sticklandii]|uniref:O-antigen ligase family protein n=1 Tax=Acetoanaerobium sticklandii TaxID=1511 RepID=UPI003A8DC584